MTTNYRVSKNLIKELKKKSIESENEICGYVLRGEFLEKSNIHPNPRDNFLIDPLETIWDEDAILFHSHPSHIKEKGFSPFDLQNQHYLQMDMLLYSVNNDEFYYNEV